MYYFYILQFINKINKNSIVYTQEKLASSYHILTRWAKIMEGGGGREGG